MRSYFVKKITMQFSVQTYLVSITKTESLRSSARENLNDSNIQNDLIRLFLDFQAQYNTL